MSDHIICPTPEENRRIQLRRQTDLSDRQKAAKFDQLMNDAAFNFDFWTREWERETDPQVKRRFESRMHIWSKILWYGTPVECPCPGCVEQRQCERVGSEQ